MRFRFDSRAESPGELLAIVFAGIMVIIVIGFLINRGFNSGAKKFSDTLEESTNAIKPPPVTVPAVPDCVCTPTQGAIGWRCGSYPCGITERLVTTNCMPAGCGPSINIKEQECVEDSACCGPFEDTLYCGTGGEKPDCAIGERVVKQTCGQDMAAYDCRPDTDGPTTDGTPSCLPRCLGEYSPNEAAAIVNPLLPIICPGDDVSLDKETGPWTRDRSGVGILTKILGQGVGVCRHPPSPLPDQKCETYCLSGHTPNPNGLTCDSMSCQKGPLTLNTTIAQEELEQGSIQDYSYIIPTSCPVLNKYSYITFNVVLKEANIQMWNYETSRWDALTTSGDNNNLLETFKLFPQGADRKYFNQGQIQWQVSQAAGDQDNFGVNITAVECNAPKIPIDLTLQEPSEMLTTDATVIRTYSIPNECVLIDQSSHFSVSVELNNAKLQVYDTNTQRWQDLVTSGKNHRQFSVLKYYPLGLDSRYFRDNQIIWRLTTARGVTEPFSARITVDDCYLNLCAGAPKSRWVNAASPTNDCTSVCAFADMSPGISPEGMNCASGKNRPMSGNGTIHYTNDCATGLGCNGNLSGPVQTYVSDIYCYRNGQNEDKQPTDVTVACYCQQ